MNVLEYYFLLNENNISEGIVGDLANWARMPGQEAIKAVGPKTIGGFGALSAALKTKDFKARAQHKLEMLKKSRNECNNQPCKDMHDKEIERAQKKIGTLRNTVKGVVSAAGSIGSSVGLMASGYTAGVSALVSVAGSLALDHLLKRGDENNFRKFKAKISALQTKTKNPKDLEKIRRQLSIMDEKYMDWKRKDAEKKREQRSAWLAQKLAGKQFG